MIASRVLLRILVVFGIATLFDTQIQAHAQGRAAFVGVDPVVREPLQQTTPVLGRLVARQRGVVAALTRGPVDEITVEVGDRVTAGDPIMRIARARIDQTRRLAGAQLTVALARVETARAELELANQELARLQKLRRSAAFNQARYDDQVKQVATRQSEVSEAEAAVTVARVDIGLADIDVRLSIVEAPYDGVVVERHTTRGAFVNVGDPVITLINDGDLEIEADIPVQRIAGLFEGRSIEALLAGTPGASPVTVEAFVRAVVPEENALTRTRAVRFMPAPGALESMTATPLAANQSVTVMTPIGDARTVISVHKDAVIPQANGNIVYVVAEGKAQPRPVQLGEAVATRFEVLSGLEPGEVVVIRGNERLRPGQAVTYPGMPKPEGSGEGSEKSSEKAASES